MSKWNFECMGVPKCNLGTRGSMVAAAGPAAVREEHVSATDRRWDSGGYP
jgi:hypothetical protein